MTDEQFIQITYMVGLQAVRSDLLREFANEVAATEREDCARLVEEIEAGCVRQDIDDPPLHRIAAAIRGTGKND